jgi:hypothetical protein
MHLRALANEERRDSVAAESNSLDLKKPSQKLKFRRLVECIALDEMQSRDDRKSGRSQR